MELLRGMQQQGGCKSMEMAFMDKRGEVYDAY